MSCDLLLFVDGFDLACVVVTAVRADAMRRLGLLTLRAQPGGRGPQRIMSPALRGAGLGMSAFWIWHLSSPVLSLRSPVQSVLRLPETVDWGLRTYFNSFSGASRGSSHCDVHWHVPVFRFVPHCEQSPAQSSRHSGFIGSAR